MSAFGYEPTPSELAANSTSAELDALKSTLVEVIGHDSTPEATRRWLREALTDARAIGDAVFNYRS